MPIGLYTSCEVSAPCGLCSPHGIIGLLDVPGTFLDPDRMNAGLIWFTRGFVEYQFPNNARHVGKAVTALECSLELSSEAPPPRPMTLRITVSVNGRELGGWTSPGDFGDRRGLYTPGWWKLKGSQYGMLKSFRVTPDGAFVDGVRISSLTPKDLTCRLTIRFDLRSRSNRTRAIPAASTSSAAGSAITIRTSC